MTINDLKELDFVKLRSGLVCWVLRNEFTGNLQTCTADGWGMHELSKYYDDFTYGKGTTDYNDKMDIVAVSKSRSAWKAINNMHYYWKAVQEKDDELIEECMAEFKWIDVSVKAFWVQSSDNDFIHVKCDRCGFMEEHINTVVTGLSDTDYKDVKWNFCPQCGARMSVHRKR